MPEYLAPGVFVEETSFRSKSIEGVGTSVAGIVGPTCTGPVRGKPEVVTSFADYVRVYGEATDLNFGGDPVLNHTAIAARSFFENGGKQLFVARVVGGVNSSSETGDGTSASRAASSGDVADVSFRARFPGSAGNYVLELVWRDREDLLGVEAVTLAADQGAVLSGTVTRKSFNPVLANLGDDVLLSITAIVDLTGANFVVDGTKAICTRADTGEAVALPANAVLPAAAGLPGARFLRGSVKSPAAGPLTGDTPAELHFRSAPVGLDKLVGNLGDLATRPRLVGTLSEPGDDQVFSATKALNPGLPANVSIPVFQLAALRDSVSALVVQRDFDLEVRGRRGSEPAIADDDRDGEVVWTYADCSLDPASDTALAKQMPATPDRRADALASPVSCAVGAADAEAVLDALRELFDTGALDLAVDRITGPRYLIALTGGSDGSQPAAADYAGEIDVQKGSTGFAAFEDIEDISICMTPAAVEQSQTGHQGVVLELQKHVMKMRYRVGIVDSRLGQTLGEVRDWASNFSDTRLALYYPWVRISDPTGEREELVVPPGGLIAGLYARTDVERGVHKSPANDVLMGALGFEVTVNKFQQELLNPYGINCLRSFPGRGHRVWGARTLSDDPEWKYVAVRRYFLYLERSIDKSTQWAVFEPNGEALWANVRTTVEGFLFNEWRNGHMLGADPKEAYFVRCDRSTMTQNDLDNGRLVCLIGVAPLRPAEFVIFRVGQKTADAK